LISCNLVGERNSHLARRGGGTCNLGLRRESCSRPRYYQNEWQEAFHGLMVMTKVAVAVPLEFVALIVTLYIPAWVGVPEIRFWFGPFGGRFRPGGSAVAP
jgi:hypothetical protein